MSGRYPLELTVNGGGELPHRARSAQDTRGFDTVLAAAPRQVPGGSCLDLLSARRGSLFAPSPGPGPARDGCFVNNGHQAPQGPTCPTPAAGLERPSLDPVQDLCPFTLNNGDAVEVKALVKDFRIVATKIEREDEDDH